MNPFKHLWPFSRKAPDKFEYRIAPDTHTQGAGCEPQPDGSVVRWAYVPPPKRNRHGTLGGLLKPEKATTYDGLTLRMLMTGMPITVKTLNRFMGAQLGNRTPNDVGASIRRVRIHLREQSIELHECDVNPERGARHKKHWLTPDDIRRLQAMKPGACL